MSYLVESITLRVWHFKMIDTELKGDRALIGKEMSDPVQSLVQPPSKGFDVQPWGKVWVTEDVC